MTTGLNAAQCGIGRAALGLDPAALAAKAGVTTRDVLSLEGGETPAPDIAKKIADALADGGITFHLGPDGSARMRVRTLDGIMDAPVAMR